MLKTQNNKILSLISRISVVSATIFVAGFLYFGLPSTTLAAVGSYTSVHWDTNADGALTDVGIAYDGTYYYVADDTSGAAKVYKYNSSGVYQSNFNIESSGVQDPEGIVWDGTDLWIVDDADQEVYKFSTSGTYSGTHFDTSGQSVAGKGITYDGTYFWIISGDVVYKYDHSGTYQSVSWSAATQTTNSTDITYDGTYFWVVATTIAEVFKYNYSGTYQTFSFDTSTQATNVTGIVYNGTDFAITSSTNDEVYKYEAISGAFPVWTPPASCDDGIENQDETAIDMGGVCMVAEITFPVDTTTQEDFAQWSVHVAGVDGLDNTFQVGVHYSTDSTLLTTCEDFPSGHGYTDCFTPTPRIYADYGGAFSGADIGFDNNFPVDHAVPFVVGQTYYAQAIIQIDDAFGALLLAGPQISFTVGLPGSGTGGLPGGGASSCSYYDLLCWGKQLLGWAFLPSDASLHQFTNIISFSDPDSSLLATKLPFSYGFDILVMWNELFDTSASGTLGISVPNLGGGSALDLLSATTISNSSWYGSIVRPFISVGLYLMAFWIVYKKVFGIFDASNKTV